MAIFFSGGLHGPSFVMKRVYFWEKKVLLHVKSQVFRCKFQENKSMLGSFFLAVQITILVDPSNEPKMCQ